MVFLHDDGLNQKNHGLNQHGLNQPMVFLNPTPDEHSRYFSTDLIDHFGHSGHFRSEH